MFTAPKLVSGTATAGNNFLTVFLVSRYRTHREQIQVRERELSIPGSKRLPELVIHIGEFC